MVLHAAYSQVGDQEQFYSILTSLISYLCRQKNLISQMRSQAPTVADTHWESMGGVVGWFKQHCVDIIAYLVEKKMPACNPPKQWWIELMVITVFAAQATTTFKQLQGNHIMVGAQWVSINQLCQCCREDLSVIGPLAEDDTNALDLLAWVFSEDCSFAVALSSADLYIRCQGSFVLDKISEVEQNLYVKSVKGVAQFYVKIVSGLDNIVAQRDSNNEADEQLP